MGEEEIGGLTLLEYDALVKRVQADHNRERLNFGIVASAVLNSAPGDGGREAVQPWAFLPKAARPKEVDLTNMSPLQQRDYLLNMFSKRVLRK